MIGSTDGKNRTPRLVGLCDRAPRRELLKKTFASFVAATLLMSSNSTISAFTPPSPVVALPAVRVLSNRTDSLVGDQGEPLEPSHRVAANAPIRLNPDDPALLDLQLGFGTIELVDPTDFDAAPLGMGAPVLAGLFVEEAQAVELPDAVEAAPAEWMGPPWEGELQLADAGIDWNCKVATGPFYDAGEPTAIADPSVDAMTPVIEAPSPIAQAPEAVAFEAPEAPFTDSPECALAALLAFNIDERLPEPTAAPEQMKPAEPSEPAEQVEPAEAPEPTEPDVIDEPTETEELDAPPVADAVDEPNEPAKVAAPSAMDEATEPPEPAAAPVEETRVVKQAPAIPATPKAAPETPQLAQVTMVKPPPAAETPAPTGMGDDLIKAIDVHDANARLIAVSKNTSAVIDLNRPATRAEVADPSVADISVVNPTRIVVTGKNYGLTQLMVSVGDRQEVFNVTVELDLSVLEAAIKSIAPTANVRARSVNGQVVLTGTVPDATTSDQIAQLAGLFQGGKVTNQLSVAGVQQTMLRVVVAEVNKDAVRQLGFNWAIGASDFSRDFFFGNNVAQLNPTTFTSSGLANVRTGQLAYSVAPVANGANTNITFGFPRAEFQVFMNALRRNALARVLAEPNLVAISGQTATFLAGGEVPIPVTQGGATAGSITIEYKEFGVRLGFTPTVLGGQIVRLHILSEVSEAVPGGSIAGGLPVFSFTTRRVESTIECGNGQTFAIAGLLNERVQSVAEKIPGLGDLPVLGALFSSVDYRKNNTELVVLVTPQLVEPLDPQQVPPPPGALTGHPNDFELFALGQLEGAPREMPELNGVPREHAPANVFPGDEAAHEFELMSIRGPSGLADVGEN